MQGVMPLKRKGEEWADGMRAQIKAELGLGWTLANHVQRGVVTGRTKLTHRNSDGQRSSVMLDIPFSEATRAITGPELFSCLSGSLQPVAALD